MANLKKALTKKIQEESSEWLDEQPAWLGDYDEVVQTGVGGMLYARLVNGKVIQVFNSVHVAPDYDQLVIIGRSRTLPSIWQIIRVRETYVDPSAGGRVEYHHTQHEFPDGPDIVWLDRKQILPLTVLVSDAAGFVVRVFGAWVRTATGMKKINTQLVDLSSSVPADGAVYASIETNNNGVLSVNVGTGFAGPTFGDPSYIPVPSTGKYTLAVVLLYAEQTELSNDDISVPMPLQVPASSSGDLGWINVKDYGAVGDGVTNDGSAINSAIAALNAAGRGVLYFPPGDYLVSAGLTAITADGIALGAGIASYDNAVYSSRITCSSSTAALFTVNSKYFKFEDIALYNSAVSVTAGAGITATSSYIAQRVDYSHVYIKGFWIGVDVQVGAEWTMDSCIIISRTKYGVKIRNTVNPDAGDWKISNCSIYCDGANADAGIRIESSGGGKVVNNKINTGPGATYHFTYGIDISASGTTSIMLLANNSIENIATNPIHVVGNWDYIVINGCQLAKYTSGAHNAIYFDGPDHFIIDDVVCIGNSPSTAAAAISLNNCTYGSIGLLQTRYFTSDISLTSCTNITTLPTLSSSTPADVASAGAAGSGTSASKDNHAHKGVHSLAKSGGSALYGDVTLSAGTGIAITPSGNDLEIASIASDGSGGHAHGLERWNGAASQTTFDLSDTWQMVESLQINGLVEDPLVYSLSSDGTQIILDTALDSAATVTANGILLQV